MSDQIIDGYKFVSREHADTYTDAKKLLENEIERQKQEAERLNREWDRFSDDDKTEYRATLVRHFAACREPYVKLLCDVLAIASPVILVETPQ